MRNWKIKNRILFLAIVPAAGIAALLLMLFVVGGVTEMDKALKERGAAIARQLAPACEYGVFSGNRAILQAIVQSVMKESDVKSVVITDGDSRILAVSGRPASLIAAPGRVSAAPDFSGIRQGDGDSLIFSAPIHQGEIEIDDYGMELSGDSLRKKNGGRKILGQVYVEISTATASQRKFQFIAASMLIGILGLGGAVALALRMSRDVTHPLTRLLEAVGKMANGDLDSRVAAVSGGELAELENGFNGMAAKLQFSQEIMQKRINEATALLSHQANHDGLTGLVNRREFEERLKLALERAKEHSARYVLCYMDLDQFKIVNDTCGHLAGDELLRQLALLLQGRTRAGDTLARLGGDEFGLLMEGCQPEDALRIAEEVREMVKNFRFVWQEKTFAIGISIGLVAINRDSGVLTEVMRAADAACYAAKDKGRNRVHIYNSEDSSLLRRHGEMQWVGRIAQALEENRFQLYCQHIVPLHQDTDGKERFEVLLRMVGEGGEIIPPMAFIPAAERYNLMPALDRWVISAAFTALRRLVESGAPKEISINLSGASLSDHSLLDFIQRQIASHGVPPHCVCFEVTETAAVINLNETQALIKQLKALGCLFSLDDFGSGMSSFTYLKTLPVDYLKIEGSFARDMVEDPTAHTMLQSINNIGHIMGLKTIAEYAESETIVNKLAALGVDYAQGYWLGEPRPLDDWISGVLGKQQ